MAPSPGSIHRRPRRDSGAARLWEWACKQRRAWTAAEAAEAAGISERRTRAYVRALHKAELIERRSEWDPGSRAAARWVVPARCRKLPAPVMMVEPGGSRIIGVRRPGDGAGNDRLRRALGGVAAWAAHHRLRTAHRTLKGILRDEIAIGADDPIIARAVRRRK